MGRPAADHPIYRRRALAARAATFAEYAHERLAPLIVAAQELGVPVPAEAATFPAAMKAWADALERARP
jgi:hypothetical protein